MDFNQSLIALSALGQETRLQVFRLLIRAGNQGMQAGDISDALGVRQNTMSANLGVLLRAGLIRNAREGRIIRYYANIDGIRGLLEFLMEDCCGGNAALCKSVLAEIICEC